MIDENKFPYLDKTIEYLNSKTFLFKNVLKQIEQSDANYQIGEKLCRDIFILSDSDWQKYFKRVNDLTDFSYDFVRLQLELEKTGHYKYATFEEVEREAYKGLAGELDGPQYLWGMFFSLFFWPGRNKIFNFFLNDFIVDRPEAGTILEVPLGSGIFLSSFLSKYSGWKGAGLDISDNAIDFSRKYLKMNGIGEDRVEFIKHDIFTYETTKVFDLILCGDFLEHVHDPLFLLKKLNGMLAPDGNIFVSAAVWAANIDHIYLYKSAQEIRDHFDLAGFKVHKELIHNVYPKATPEQGKTPIHYCAIIAKK